MANELFTHALNSAYSGDAEADAAFVQFAREVRRKLDYLQANAVRLRLNPETEIHDEALILTEVRAFTAPLWRGFWEDRALARIEEDMRKSP